MKIFFFFFFFVCLGFQGQKKSERSGIRSKTKLTRGGVDGEYF